MKQPTSFHRRPASGFTLVELLVSISVLSIMAVALATMMSFVMKTWVSGINSVDNFTKARVVLNLLDRDIQTMVMRRDLAAFVSTSGTSACQFYSNVEGNPGTGETNPDTRTMSLVQYQLVSSSTASTFQRTNYGANFLATTGTPPTIGNIFNLSAPANSNSSTESVFTGVIQFQIQFIDGNGVILTPPYQLSATPPLASPSTLPTPFWFDYTNPGGAYNPRVVVVSMLVLSNSAYKVAQQTKTTGGIATLTQLQTDFPVGTSTALPSPMANNPQVQINGNTYANQTYAQYWDGILSGSSFDPTLPAAVRDRGAIQVFERHIPLPITTPSS